MIEDEENPEEAVAPDDDLSEMLVDEDDIDKSVIRPYFSFEMGLGENYPNCDQEIYRVGKVITASEIGKDATEIICSNLRQKGFRIDWHFVPISRITIKGIGDREAMVSAWKKEFENYVEQFERERFKYHAQAVES